MLDIDRDRQRISLGLKQTQEDPWQRIVDTYNVGDELDGKVTKVVTFGAFVEILDGVEGLVHISELAPHHVESPREIVHPGDEIRVKILEIDSERRRLSLSAKRVEDQILPVSRPGQPDDRRRGAAEPQDGEAARGSRRGARRRGAPPRPQAAEAAPRPPRPRPRRGAEAAAAAAEDAPRRAELPRRRCRGRRGRAAEAPRRRGRRGRPRRRAEADAPSAAAEAPAAEDAGRGRRRSRRRGRRRSPSPSCRRTPQQD